MYPFGAVGYRDFFIKLIQLQATGMATNQYYANKEDAGLVSDLILPGCSGILMGRVGLEVY